MLNVSICANSAYLFIFFKNINAVCYFISQHYASRGGHVTVCAFLLETGACASPRTPAGATPLHRAAYCGHVDVVGLLLRRGADPTLCDDDGATALHKVHLPTDFTSFLCPADGGVTPLSLSLFPKLPSCRRRNEVTETFVSCSFNDVRH